MGQKIDWQPSPWSCYKGHFTGDSDTVRATSFDREIIYKVCIISGQGFFMHEQT